MKFPDSPDTNTPLGCRTKPAEIELQFLIGLSKLYKYKNITRCEA